MVLVCVAGVGLGIFQIRLTMRLMKKPNVWLAVAKLPLWALPMWAVARFSVPALLSLTAGASGTYLGYIVIQWRALRKGDEQ